MRNVGLLVTKNEAPILEETLKANTRYIKEIYALYGGNDDTENILKRFKEVKYCIHESEILSEASGHHLKSSKPPAVVNDGVRGVLYNIIKENYNIGDWITLMHGDEIFYHDPNISVALAALNQYNVVVWYASQFFFTKDDLINWENLKGKSLEKKMTWYATNQYPWKEYRQFQIQTGSCYDMNKHCKVIPNLANTKCLPVCPIYKHYKIWNLNIDDYGVHYSKKLRKNVSSLIGKWGSLHWEINKFEDFFIDHYPGYKNKHQFQGDFGSFETSFNNALEDFQQYLRDRNLTLQDIVENAPCFD